MFYMSLIRIELNLNSKHFQSFEFVNSRWRIHNEYKVCVSVVDIKYFSSFDDKKYSCFILSTALELTLALDRSKDNSCMILPREGRGWALARLGARSISSIFRPIACVNIKVYLIFGTRVSVADLWIFEINDFAFTNRLKVRVHCYPT